MVIYGWYVKGGDVMGICMGGVKTGMAELGVSMRMAGGGGGGRALPQLNHIENYHDWVRLYISDSFHSLNTHTTSGCVYVYVYTSLLYPPQWCTCATGVRTHTHPSVITKTLTGITIISWPAFPWRYTTDTMIILLIHPKKNRITLSLVGH